MGRLLDVDERGKRIRIDFPYEPELVDVVRTLPDRRFDRRSKCWFVPLEHLEYVIERLQGYRFKYSPALRRVRQKNGDDRSERPQKVTVPEGTWTVSRLNQAAKAALRQRFRDPLWVVGELQDYDKNRSSKYPTYFFDLVERPFAGASEVAKIKAVMFERHREEIEEKLRGSDLVLSDGLTVRLGGQVDLYHRNGRYQFRVEEIDPAYTVGEIALNRERVFKKLKARGIAEKNQRLPWPVCPLRVGLITSFESDAYNDFVHQLRESRRGFAVTVFDVNVQGTNTEPSVLRALEYFRHRAEKFDLLVITRGGGSRSELSYFDTEAIGAAVCLHPVKIVSGVGHQRDTSLLDMIAASTKTPTAAAECIIDRVERYSRAMEESFEAIARGARRSLERQEQELRRRGNRLQRQVMGTLESVRRRMQRVETSVARSSRGALEKRRREIDGQRRSLEYLQKRALQRRRVDVERVEGALAPKRLLVRLRRRRSRLDAVVERLARSSRRQIQAQRDRFEYLDNQLDLIDPQRVLERGFAILRTCDSVIRSHRELAVGDDFDVILGDGVLRARRLAGDEESFRGTDEAKEETEPAE